MDGMVTSVCGTGIETLETTFAAITRTMLADGAEGLRDRLVGTLGGSISVSSEDPV